ncbi:conditioned medium-induced protein 4 [Haloplanus sp. C73]|uniref:conditioned medium-induced protein 4 n=1 Tax=Haloplanus sp. C73 TaxID=3421641 RepID=UPI003EBE072A
MDEKTAELRDIFLDATDGEETVTESQAKRRGSLVDADSDSPAVDARLRELVTAMRERYDFETALDTESYVRVIRAFYDGKSDDAIAAAVDVDVETAVQARLDCHLVREDEDSPAATASRERSVRVNHRFRDEFADLLTDDALSERLASDSREDGLREATEDIETDVSF